jgi:hypothetical protein
MKVVAAEENARLVAKELAKGVQVEVKPTPPASSKVVKLKDILLPETLVDERGTGHMKEFVVKSTSKDYVLEVYVDGSKLYYDDFTWFQNMSQVLEEVDAFEEDGVYVLRLSNIHYTNSLEIAAEPSPTATTTLKLNEVFCKLDVFD